ncbi:MAG: M14 family zinc carboxypeptidase [Armatimonadota bacterium]
MADQLSPTRLLLELSPAVHNWFAGTFTNLPVGQPVTFGFSMTGKDSRGNPADVSKWRGLVPVMTHADPARYESYEWFRKDIRGHWISGDPLKTEPERDAGTGPVPEQQALPAELAGGFLSADGGYWAPWREVDTTETLTGVNIFRITQTFNAPTATVAMRVPFTYSYLQALLARLQARRFPGVTVEKIGKTHGGRALQIIRLDDPEAHAGQAPAKTILLVAREHGTEPASSWVLTGVLSALLRQTPEARQLRNGVTWLLLPIQDPDGSTGAQFDRLTELFLDAPADEAMSPEAFAYARYFTKYIYAGRAIHVAVSLHNVEANETEQVMCPFITTRDKPQALRFNQAFFQALTARGFVTGDPERPWAYGFAPGRIHGWCGEQFGAFTLAFEVNDRYPETRLALDRQQEIGGVLAGSLSRWLTTPDGKFVCARAEQLARLKRLERAAYFSRAGHGPEARTSVELVTRGF